MHWLNSTIIWIKIKKKERYCYRNLSLWQKRQHAPSPSIFLIDIVNEHTYQQSESDFCGREFLE